MPDEIIVVGNQQQQIAKDPQNNPVEVSITGTVNSTNVPMAANASWDSGWLPRGQYLGAQTILYSDVPGSYKIYYSDDEGVTESMPMVTISYILVETTRKGAFDISAAWVRFVYTNGGVAQNKFKFELRFLSNPAQVSMETLNTLGADSRFAQWTKTRIETKDPDNGGSYDYIGRKDHSLLAHISNIPAVQNVAIQGTPSVNANVTFPSTQQVGGTVAISNASIAVTDNNGSLTVDGQVNIGNFPTTQAITGNVGITGNVSTTPSGTQNVSGTVAVSNFPANQPVSGSVTITNPVTAVSVNNFPATQAVTGPLTDAQLRATAVLVSGSFFQPTQPISATVLPLPTNAATSAKQDGMQTTLTSIDNKVASAAKQDTGNNSLSTIATNTTGGATSAKQDTMISSLATIATNSSVNAPATAGTLTQYTLSAGVAQTIAASATRKGVTMISVTGTVLITPGATSTTSLYAYRIGQNGTYEAKPSDVQLSFSIISATAATLNVLTT